MCKKILILGGTGAMGTSLVEQAAQMRYDVYVTSRKVRRSDDKNIHYVQGDAHDLSFLSVLLKDSYDAVIDFMIYTSKQLFEERVDLFLNATKQYFFLSSSTVYAESNGKITEETSRFVDVHGVERAMYNRPYIAYKAQQEDVLKQCKNKNWTIIRPYITYAEERIQLGNFEKEIWLYRALKNKTIVFPEEVSERVTTLTYGKDVARAILKMIGNEKAYGEIFHITTSQSIKWKKVLEIYLNTIEEIMGFCPAVKASERNAFYSSPDRLQDRIFDNRKIQELAKLDFTDVETGLKQCVKSFIEEKREFREIPWAIHGRHDRIAGEYMDIDDIPSENGKKDYMLERFAGYVINIPVLEDKEQSRLLEKWKDFSKKTLADEWRKLKNVFDEYGAKRIGIYAYSNFAKQLLFILEAVKDSEIEYFLYDSDCEKWGKKVQGCEITSPKEMDSHQIDLLLISSKRNYMDIYEMYQHLAEAGVKILGTGAFE